MSSIVPSIQQIYTNMNVPTPGGLVRSTGLSTNLRPDFLTKGLNLGAQAIGLGIAEALVKSAGTKGSTRMSLLGGDAPVYQTPFNDVKESEVSNPPRFADLRGSGAPIKAVPAEKPPAPVNAPPLASIPATPSGMDTRTGSRVAALPANSTDRFKKSFQDGQTNMAAIQQMYGDRPDLQEWAKANPALAQKQYEKFQKKQKAMDISAFQADSGMSKEAAETILSGGARETVIDGSKPMVTTMIPASKFGGQQVQIPGSTESKLDQETQDLISAKQETGAASFTAEEILGAKNADEFLKRALERIKASR
jgi:hypothetical protein